MTDSPFRRKALAFHRCGAYISFLPEERPYFQGIQGGMGAKVWSSVMHKGTVPSFGNLQATIKHLEEVWARYMDPSWGADAEPKRILGGLLDKLKKYMSEVYPTGRPRQVRQPGIKVFQQKLIEGGTKDVLAKKIFMKFRDRPALAYTIALDALTDANFHSIVRILGEILPIVADSEIPDLRRMKLSPQAVASAYDWSDGLFDLVIGLMIHYKDPKVNRVLKILAAEREYFSHL